ncbi:MAG: hypothetical protein Q9160_004712 [Pyrenula sp. 1 TL-2023]
MSLGHHSFEYERHVKYWLRCAKTHLPGGYVSTDSNRMMLGFFIVSALDLLGVLQRESLAQERAIFVEWIYRCQLPTGGFKGFTGADLGLEVRRPETEPWDPANVPATLFALLTLIILGDDLAKVEKSGCLLWLRKLQRQDGSFGEVLGIGDSIQGGHDLRFCYCAAGVRLLLRSRMLEGNDRIADDIDIGRLLMYIRACQVDENLPLDKGLPKSHGISLETCVRWITARQTLDLDDDDEDPIDLTDGKAKQQWQGSRYAGFNGRQNKVADTCYAFWNLGALAMLNRRDVIDKEGLRQYLLGKTQHIIGGFAKAPGEVPDILHAYLGLATLSIIGDPNLPALNPTFCISQATWTKFENTY